MGFRCGVFGVDERWVLGLWVFLGIFFGLRCLGGVFFIWVLYVGIVV